MAIKTGKIIKRIRDGNLTDSESDRRKEDLAIAFLEICAKEAHEWAEFCRLRLHAPNEGSKLPLPKSRLSLWIKYKRDVCEDFEGPIDPYIEDDDSPPSIIAAAIEALVNAEAFNRWENIDPEPQEKSEVEQKKDFGLASNMPNIAEEPATKGVLEFRGIELKGLSAQVDKSGWIDLNENEAELLKVLITAAKDYAENKGGNGYASKAVLPSNYRSTKSRMPEILQSEIYSEPGARKGYCLKRIKSPTVT